MRASLGSVRFRVKARVLRAVNRMEKRTVSVRLEDTWPLGSARTIKVW